MRINEILKLIGDKEFLDKIYQFSYRRCNTSYEAEDLCSDIILAVISAVHKQEQIENFYAFVWTVARRVYADFCKNRTKLRQVYCEDLTAPGFTAATATTRTISAAILMFLYAIFTAEEWTDTFIAVKRSPTTKSCG